MDPKLLGYLLDHIWEMGFRDAYDLDNFDLFKKLEILANKLNIIIEAKRDDIDKIKFEVTIRPAPYRVK